MFRSITAKIVSAPVEEILEVLTPIEDEWEEVEAWEEEPKFEQVTNIEFLAVKYVEDEMQWGTLTDYDGYEFNYQWDTKSKRIVRLVGPKVDKLTWDLCNDVLRKYYIKPELPKVEEPIGPQIEQAINKALGPVNSAIKTLEGKVEKALTAKPAPAPAPVQAAPAPRPQAVQSSPVEAPAISVGDDDISVNAARFLQESNVDDLGIDYMSL